MDRDPALERQLLDLAARAAGLPPDNGLHDFADHRAHPGPVRLPRDFDREVREEIADAANYVRWTIQESYPAFLAGDAAAGDAYERHMRVLVKLTEAWHELHRGAA